MADLPTPRGFSSYTARLGLKDDSDDFAVVRSDRPAVSAAVFTRSRFAGPSVLLSREAMAAGAFQAVVVLARNANVATGAEGRANAVEVRAAVAAANGLAEPEVLISSTGVIGVQYPMPELRPQLAQLPAAGPDADFDAVATAMMTTDTHPKVARARVGDAVIVGVAKGVGMIEPNMATLLTYFFTDAQLPPEELDRAFRAVIDRTFNALSIDTDTSTSDTAAILANGAAGPVDPAAFESGLYDVALALTRDIAGDGEGASKLIEVRVTGARDDAQAKRVGKSVVNSPLVKTAVHGADPNWGRVAMAIGKLEDELDIEPQRVSIAFGPTTVYPEQVDDGVLGELREYLRGAEVVIEIGLGIAHGAFTVYGCDLTDGYIRINADYTT
jgi:glutamate N-acetyltransferase/amino-acid N-acetyltransferase